MANNKILLISATIICIVLVFNIDFYHLFNLKVNLASYLGILSMVCCIVSAVMQNKKDKKRKNKFFNRN